MSKLFTRSRLGRGLAATALISAGALAATSQPASAASIFSEFDVLHSGQAMNVAFASQANQGWVGQFPFQGVNVAHNDEWTKSFVSSTPAAGSNLNTPAFELIARHSGKCLDIQGGVSKAAGVPLVQADCDGTVSQRWYTHKVADHGLLTGVGYRYIYNVHSGLVIDVANASLSPGAPLGQWPQKPLSQAQNQLWHEGLGGVG